MSERFCQKCGTFLYPLESRCRTCGFDAKASPGVPVAEPFDAAAEIAKLRAEVAASKTPAKKGMVRKAVDKVKAAVGA